MKKYKDLIGIPSGEVLSLPISIIILLKEERLIRKDAIFNGDKNIVYYVFDDENLDKIIDFLSYVDDKLWNS